MTVLEVYQECLKIWDGLAESGDDTKPKTQFQTDCPCCDYVETIDIDPKVYNSCSKCPLIELWNADHKYNDTLEDEDVHFEACHEIPTSPYNIWQLAKTDEHRKECAKIIADHCRKKIEELREK